MQSEQAVREELKKEWSTFSAADKQHCVSLAKTGGESSYTELLTCLEMARDVRAMRAEAAPSRAASPTRARSYATEADCAASTSRSCRLARRSSPSYVLAIDADCAASTSRTGFAANFG